MDSPISHANPTKLIFALLAGHVVASLILFNSGTALWTWLCICQNPIGCLRFILTLFIPDCQFLAVAGSVWFFATCNAKGKIASIA
jgi:ABC-type multidrug transport system permease subunit